MQHHPIGDSGFPRLRRRTCSLNRSLHDTFYHGGLDTPSAGLFGGVCLGSTIFLHSCASY